MVEGLEKNGGRSYFHETENLNTPLIYAFKVSYLLPSKQSGTRLSEEGHGVAVQEVYAVKRELSLFS